MTAAEAQVIASSRSRAKHPDPWLMVNEIAEQLRVSRMTVYRAANGDYLRSVRIGRSIRIRTSWLDAWVAAGCPTHETYDR